MLFFFTPIHWITIERKLFPPFAVLWCKVKLSQTFHTWGLLFSTKKLTTRQWPALMAFWCSTTISYVTVLLVLLILLVSFGACRNNNQLLKLPNLNLFIQSDYSPLGTINLSHWFQLENSSSGFICLLLTKTWTLIKDKNWTNKYDTIKEINLDFPLGQKVFKWSNTIFFTKT